MLVPIKGAFFEDNIDGYFELRDSLRHLLDRHGFAAAYLALAHAPIMALADWPRDAPVPLRLTRGAAGTLRRAALFARATEDGTALSGWARWLWLDGRPCEDNFRAEWRLAEPCFLRGIGFASGETQVAGNVLLATADESPFSIGDPASLPAERRNRYRAFPFGGLNGITPEPPGAAAWMGALPGPSLSVPSVLVEIGAPQVRRAAERLAAER